MVFRKVHMIEIKEILLRITAKDSIRKISLSLSIHRETIRNYIELAKRHGFDPYEDSKDKITDALVEKIKADVARASSRSLLIPRNEILLPCKDEIEEYLESGLKGSKIITLLARKGVNVSRQSFYRFVQQCDGYKKARVTVRLPESQPGQYSQADFGRLGKLWDAAASRLRTAYALVITLCYSRHMFVYVSFKQDIAAVISGFEAAWAYFGGTTQIVIIDNIKAAIDRSDRYSPRINKTFLEYAQFRGFVIDPTNAAHPKGKPIVERGIPYVRDNFFAAEAFIDKEDCQQRAIHWCSTVAGKRIHGTTRQVPIVTFEEIEKIKLTPYPGDRYDIVSWALCKVHPDHHIRFKNSLYSLPTRYIGKHVEVRGDSSLVKIYQGGSLIKVHRTVAAGKRSTDFEDYPKELTPYALRNPKYQIREGYAKSQVIGAFIEEILSGPYPWHRLRSAQKILRLSERYGIERMSSALSKAKAYSIHDMRRIENILKNGVEDTQDKVELRSPLDKSVQLRFLREPQSFNNYKK